MKYFLIAWAIIIAITLIVYAIKRYNEREQ